MKVRPHFPSCGRAAAVAALLLLGAPAASSAAAKAPERVAVLYPEGRIRGFLVLRDLDGKALATGGLTQLYDGSRVTAELRLHFNDGSVHDETAVYSQRKNFRLLAYHLVQKGAAFPRQLDLAIDAARGQVTVKHSEEGKKEETIRERMELPADLANGILPTVLADIDPKKTKTTLSMLATTPKPRLVKLVISPDGEEPFSIAGSPLSAERFKVHIEIGGIAGAVAPLVGKQPPDTKIWMIGGKAPGFLRSEGPLFPDGPVWRIELAAPVWAKAGEEKR